MPVRSPRVPNFLMMYWPTLSARLEFLCECRGKVNTDSSILCICSLKMKVNIFFKVRLIMT